MGSTEDDEGIRTMDKYILTGGSGTGKSSVILALEMKGEYVVREVAEDYIKLQQARGIAKPWEEADFQRNIWKLQLQRNKRIHPSAKRVIFDRGVADGLAYVDIGPLYEIIKNSIDLLLCRGVFLLETLGDIETNEVRREDLEESIALGNRLEEIYTHLGRKPIRIPACTVDERADRILEGIAHAEYQLRGV